MSHPSSLRIVLLSSEAAPFSKTGGLADVAGALPQALAALGHQAVLMAPCHRSSWKAGELTATGLTIRASAGQQILEADLYQAPMGNGAVAYLIDRPEYFDRPELYGERGRDYHDNCERFVFFARAALEAIRLLDLRPDVVHCNDWQTGLVPVYLRERPQCVGAGGSRVGALMTIHNMAYQGRFWRFDMPLTGLPWSLFHWQALEFHGQINFLKAGLVYSDLISTVSPTYAKEIQSPEFGHGLDGLLRHRSADLRGILNGIDVTEWNPRTDPALARRYDEETFVEGKAECKAALQLRAGLPVRPDVPLIGAISRLDPQKGWDMIAQVLPELLEGDVQVVILGVGHEHYHALLNQLASRHADRVRTFLQFDSALAHQIEAGSDMFLMPSIYEPCGLNQMYSQTYGTPPIVRSTGGLADTVDDATPENLGNGKAAGFVFHDASPQALRDAILRALGLWRFERGLWHRLVRNGMTRDFSWNRSALSYVQVYNEIRKRREAHAA